MNNINVVINKKDLYDLCKYKANKTDVEHLFLMKYSKFRKDLLRNEFKNKPDFKIKPLQLKFIEFIQFPNVLFINDEWETCFNHFKDDKKSLILFDPPYLKSDNSFFTQQSLNVYDYFLNNNFSTFNSKLVFIFEKIEDYSKLFNNYNTIAEYKVKYGYSKSIKNHIMISN